MNKLGSMFGSTSATFVMEMSDEWNRTPFHLTRNVSGVYAQNGTEIGTEFCGSVPLQSTAGQSLICNMELRNRDFTIIEKRIKI